MWTKALVFLLMIVILYNLFRGLFFLIKGHHDDHKKVVRSLTYRVIFSACLLALLVIAGLMGWIEPHSVNPAQDIASPVQHTDAQPATP